VTALKKRNWQVVLGGEGGQGLVVAGVILGAAAVNDGMNAAQTASYGIASRGGFSKAEVVISEDEIEFPSVEEPDAVVAFSRVALEKYYGKTREGCYLIYDSSLVDGEYSGTRVLGVPMTEKIRQIKKESGQILALNIVGLGALIGNTGMVSVEAMEEAIKEQFKKGFDTNRKALQSGIELAAAAKAKGTYL
jgi:2-oxoglutarate ferredoxin oxidoreductase subunit gamma